MGSALSSALSARLDSQGVTVNASHSVKKASLAQMASASNAVLCAKLARKLRIDVTPVMKSATISHSINLCQLSASVPQFVHRALLKKWKVSAQNAVLLATLVPIRLISALAASTIKGARLTCTWWEIMSVRKVVRISRRRTG